VRLEAALIQIEFFVFQVAGAEQAAVLGAHDGAQRAVAEGLVAFEVDHAHADGAAFIHAKDDADFVFDLHFLAADLLAVAGDGLDGVVAPDVGEGAILVVLLDQAAVFVDLPFKVAAAFVGLDRGQQLGGADGFVAFEFDLGNRGAFNQVDVEADAAGPRYGLGGTDVDEVRRFDQAAVVFVPDFQFKRASFARADQAQDGAFVDAGQAAELDFLDDLAFVRIGGRAIAFGGSSSQRRSRSGEGAKDNDR